MKKALLIGINYNGSKNELSGCINDVHALKSILKHKLNYSSFVILTDDEKIKPTKKNIIKEIKKIIADSINCEEIWIHYSGHGYFIKDSNNDEIDGNDEVLVPLDFSKNGYIIDDELNNLILQTKCQTKITFDCCHSGTMFDLYYNLQIKNNQLINSFELSQLGQENKCDSDIFMISGCMDSQTSAENKKNLSNKQMGAMTTTLLKVLDEYNYNINVGNLIIQMNETLIKSKYSQIPVFSSNKNISLKKTFVSSNQREQNMVQKKTEQNKILNNVEEKFEIKNTKQNKSEKEKKQKNKIKTEIIENIKNIIKKYKKN